MSQKPSELSRLVRWNRILFCIAAGMLAWRVVRVLWIAFQGEFEFYFSTSEGIQRAQTEQLSQAAYMGMLALASCSDLFWIFGIYYLARMSWLVGQMNLFTASVVKQLRSFGWCLLGSSVCSLFVPMLLGVYMNFHGVVAPLKTPLAHIGLEEFQGEFIGALLVVVLCEIILAANRLSDDVRLTI